MKNRKILLPALLSIALVFILILPASLLNMTSILTQGEVKCIDDAGSGHGMELKSDCPVVATGFYSETEFAKWNLGLVSLASDIENVTWVLALYREYDNLMVFLRSPINVTFEGGRVFGRAGCNYYHGDYELEGNNISITRLSNTEMYCGEQINKLEQEYFAALRDAESYEIEGGKLRINCGNRLLVFNESYNSMEWCRWIIVSPAGIAGLAIFFNIKKWEHWIMIIVSPSAVAGLVIFFNSMDIEGLPWIIVGSAAVAGLVIFLLHRRRHT